ncbi:nuclease [Parasulfuritortus cantonensis]|uniref:DNA 3'-5' helicase II n=1 Tax=Parasulfuritortus cantonensis TaxID=2528202 RepID=A0A4R1BL40_9PROT|nr:ATP-binding domain-containing protein [Parasulfuritortus cantonensis]TCJ17968.1 nuclease [Parasulfuritortus cantonensis]
MARVHPDGWRELKPVGAAAREIETLERLADGLPDSYTVYHGVHWTRVQEGHACIGEIDFIIVNPAGRLLLIEQKTGLLEETADGLAKPGGERGRRLVVHMARHTEALRSRLNAACQGAGPAVDALLHCPDYVVKSPGTAGIDPSRIVDAGKRGRLLDVVRTLLGDEAAAPLAAKVHRFLRDELHLVPDVDAAIGRSRQVYTRLAGGLAHWARHIDCRPFRLRITGTAGSGKTQLALQVVRDAVAAGRRPLYVCYNRPLADHIALLAPPGTLVATYHQLGDRILRATGRAPDFARPDAFRGLEQFLADYRPEPDWQFDELVVDEGQDFEPDWRASLLRLLRPDGRAWWLEDPMQNLYGRPGLDWAGWVTLRADTNYRTPRAILDYLNGLLAPEQAAAAGSPVSGVEVEVLRYADAEELLERTKTAVTRGLGAGFGKENIALITFRGRERSRFTPLDHLGPHSLKAFTNKYDLLGSPVYSEGDLLVDSVYRFKGRSAPCVLFTEIDFETLDEATVRKLFVGMTRATLKLVLVMSERAARAVEAGR